MDNFKFFPINKINSLPETSGVYCFKKEKKIIYIGKAVNLKNRAKQHQDLMPLADKIGCIKTGSEIEALILEARLIKKYQPKYNTAWRDDKNYFYISAIHEDFPRIFITHQPQNIGGRTSNIGPFVDGRALKETLKILRRVFPYRTCNRLPKHACLWYQLKRCPAPCLFQSKLARQIDRDGTRIKKEYKKNIGNLMTTLAQGKNSILRRLKKEMTNFSRQQKFEEALKIKNQILSLEKVFAHAPIISESKMLEVRPPTFHRAEAYDIANIQGSEATGAMVVFIDGKPDKSQYRQFKIRGGQQPNDIAMLKEVLERRLNHREWSYPDLMLIDGGRAQFNIAKKTCSKLGLERIKVMAIAKKNNELYMEGKKKPVLLKTMPRETFNTILQLRDEAHRFAQRYHHHLRKKTLLG